MKKSHRGLKLSVLCLMLLLPGVVAALPPTAETSLNTCQNTVKVQGKAFVQRTVSAVAACLQRISVELIKNNGDDVSKAAPTCVAQFRKINDTRGLGKSARERLRAKIIAKCEPGQPNVTHTVEDVTGKAAGVAEQIQAEELDDWCRHFGGDGSIDTVAEWIDCIENAHECQARQAIAAQYPRAAGWLAEVEPHMSALTPPATDLIKVTDAVAGLNAAHDAIDPDGIEGPDIKCGGASTCSTACCYVENTAAAVPDTSCFEYTAPAAGVLAFTASCPGVGSPVGSQVRTAVGAPCVAGPITVTPCAGPPNLVVIPKDSSCP